MTTNRRICLDRNASKRVIKETIIRWIETRVKETSRVSPNDFEDLHREITPQLSLNNTQYVMTWLTGKGPRKLAKILRQRGYPALPVTKLFFTNPFDQLDPGEQEAYASRYVAGTGGKGGPAVGIFCASKGDKLRNTRIEQKHALILGSMKTSMRESDRQQQLILVGQIMDGFPLNIKKKLIKIPTLFLQAPENKTH